MWSAAAILTAMAVFPGARILVAQTPAAQSPPVAAKPPAQTHAAKHSTAQRHASARRPAAASHQKPEPAAAAAQPAVPPQPQIPDWPANQKASPAEVTWDSRGLQIVASNSSLEQILHEVGTDIGARVSGLNGDQRIFGTYGPGEARDVLTKLLDGSGYNILLIGDQGNGAPRQILLSNSGAPGGTQPRPSANAQNPNGDDDNQEETGDTDQPPLEDRPPGELPARPQPMRGPLGNGTPTRTPQQMQQNNPQ